MENMLRKHKKNVMQILDKFEVNKFSEFFFFKLLRENLSKIS